MLGPTAATSDAASTPHSRVSVATVAPATLAAVPRQPACTAATAPEAGSASRIGTQSAATTATAVPASRVTTASASGTGAASSLTCTTRTTAPCTWRTRPMRGSAQPTDAAARAQPSPAPSPGRNCSCRDVNPCCATPSSARQRNIGPHGSWVQWKSGGGGGKLMRGRQDGEVVWQRRLPSAAGPGAVAAAGLPDCRGKRT